MTIDEAIAHAREKADKARESEALFLHNDIVWIARESHKRMEKYEQLAEWLEELKALRNGLNIKCDNLNEALEKGKKIGYNKAIDDCIKEVEEEEKQHNHIITKDCLFWLKREFEQLKAGVNNGTDNQ